MRKIVGGKMYDTETARLISNGKNMVLQKTSLYQKTTGEFFKLITRHKCNRLVSLKAPFEEEVIPLTGEEAEKWIEDNLTVEEYEAIFGEVEE